MKKLYLRNIHNNNNKNIYTMIQALQKPPSFYLLINLYSIHLHS